MSTLFPASLVEPNAKESDESFQIQLEAARRALGLYFNPGAGDSLFNVINDRVGNVPTAVTAPATPAMIQVCQLVSPRREGIVLAGWASSPTGVTVRYRVLVNGTVILDDVAHQAATDLWTLAPIGIVVAQGPLTVTLEAGSTSAAPVAGVFGRLAGYWIGEGTPKARGRMRR